MRFPPAPVLPDLATTSTSVNRCGYVGGWAHVTVTRAVRSPRIAHVACDGCGESWDTTVPDHVA